MVGDRLIRVAHHALITLLVVTTTIVLTAQAVVDPRFVEFNRSPDHNTQASDGTPLVQRYSLAIYQTGSSQAADTMDLGKPTPDANGVIRVDFLPLLHIVPTPGVVFEARVAAVGPGGTTNSTLSNTFSWSLVCTPAISPTNRLVGAGTATGNVGVTVGAGCTWSATSNAPWITFTGATSGTGNGSVPYSIAANPGSAQRIGTLTIAGQTFTVTQSGASCTATLTPASLTNVSATGSTGSTSVDMPTGCSWTATSNAGWLTITSGASGSGDGTTNFSVGPNPMGSPRTGTLTVAGQTFTVTQVGAPCTFSILPVSSPTLAATGGTGSTSVTALAGCTWNATSNNSSWLTITSGASGNGGGTTSFSVAANPNGVQRIGTLTVAGRTFTVTQAGLGCTASLTSPNQSVAAAGGPGTIAVAIAAGCAWTATSNQSWLTITNGASGAGSGTTSFSAAANPNGTQRTATVTIGGQAITITQAGLGCTATLATPNQSVVASGGTGSSTFTLATGCAWTATSNASWLTITTPTSGSGSGSTSFSASANPNGTQRIGTLTVAGQTLTVTQAGVGCTATLATPNQSVVASGGTGSTTFTLATGCTWSATSNASWLTITTPTSGSGSGSTSFSASANPNGTQRIGTLTIAGQTLTVTQAGVGCTATLATPNQSVVASGGTGSSAFTLATGCTWSATSNASWLTITTPTSGTGNGSTSFSASANPNGTQRIGTLTVAGQTLTVTQAGVGCTATLATPNQSVAATGGTGSSAFTLATGCNWSATSNASWLTITGPASGTGNGTASFSASANPNGAQRIGTLTIAGQTLTVTQAGVGCTATLATPNQSVVASGGTGSSAFTLATGCTWSATSNASWLTITTPTSGSGSGSTSFSASANPNGTQRIGTLTVAGQTLTVTQAGVGCTATLATPNQSVAATGGTGSSAFTLATGCNWSATSNASWLTITGPASGTGNGTASFSASANPNGAQRIGTLTVAGQTLTVTQAGVGCTATLATPNQSVAASGGTGSTTFTLATGCTWSATSNASWLTITTPTSGSGSGSTSFSASANPNGTQRIGTLTIAGQTLTVTQAGVGCTATLATPNQSVVASGGTGSSAFTLATGCTWSATSNASWLTITTPTSGTGNGSTSFSASANPNGTQRIGTLTVAGQTLTVTQAGVGCTATLATPNQSVVASGGTGSSAFTLATGCTWSATSNASWLTITGPASGTGNGTASFSASANPNGAQRIGTLTIAGQTLTVTQAGVGCTGSLATPNQSVAATGGTGSSAFTLATGCAWTATSNASWLTITTPTSGSGSGSTSFSASANPNGTQRIGTLTVAGQTLTVTQAGVGCTATLATPNQSVAATGGTGSSAFTLATGCNWSATSNASWLTITGPASGTGNGTASFSASANPNGAQRIGTLTVAGQTLTVTQAGVGCTGSLATPNQSVAATGGTGSTTFTLATGCTWSATSNASWLTITTPTSGSGSGSTSFSASANPNGTQRIGTLTIAGQTLTVTQAGVGCTATLATPNQSVVASGGTGSSAFTLATGCTWSATSNASWLTITTPTSGTGNGSTSFSASANPNGTQRIGTLTVAGQTLTVTQAGVGCTATLATPNQSVVASGGTGSSAFTLATGCTWSATSNASWLTITTPTSGTGSGSTSFSASANPNGTQRIGTLTVAGQTLTVTQAGVGCTATLATPNQSVAATGGTGSSTFTLATGCTWSATSNDSWLTITTATSGSGSGSTSFSASANPNGAQRIGTLTIAGQTLTVTQAGVGCTATLATPNQSVAATGGTGSSAFTLATGCAWTAASNDSWLTITGPASGTGNGTVSYSASANPNGTQRIGTLTVASQTFTVTQPGVGCTASLTPPSQSVVAAGGTGSTSIAVAAGCAWTATSNDSWLTITAGASGTGNGTTSFSASANPNGTQRIGTLTVASQTFTVTQAAGGSSCTSSLSPPSQAFSGTGGTGTTSLLTQTGCAWTATSNAPWLTVTSGASGSGNGSLQYSVGPNTTIAARIGTLTVADQTFTVNQNGCTASISPSSQSVAGNGATGSTSVTAPATCSWTATSNVAWITVTGGASSTGNATVSFSVASNPNPFSRSGTVTIAGGTFTVIQAANACTYTVAPTSRTSPPTGESSTITVTTQAGCSWTAATTASWITVTGSGSGSGTVNFTVAANPGAFRSGTITIATKNVVITQGAAPASPQGLRIVVSGSGAVKKQ